MKLNLFNRKSSVGTDAVYLTVSKIVVALISMVTSMLLARFRTKAEFGTYSQIIMVTDLVTTVFLLGLPNSVNYFLAKAEDDAQKQRFLSVYVTLSTILTIIIGVCLFLVTPLIIKYFNNPAITTFAYIFAVYPWASLMINSISNTCIVYGKSNQLILYNIVHAAFTLAVLLIAKFTGMSFKQYMAVYMASMMCFALFGLGWMRKLAGAIRVLLDGKLIKTVLAFSVPIGLASVVGTLNVELDKLVIGRFFSTEEYAVFANAAKELPVTMLATSLTAVLLPAMVKELKKGNNEQAVRLWGNAAKISFCIMSLIVGGLIVFAPDIMSLFYSEKYVTPDGVMVFRIYSCILIFRSIYWGIVLNSTGKTKFIFYSSLLTLGANVIGNIGFYYIFGFIGPALSSLAVTLVMNFVQLKFTTKVIDIKIRHILPWKEIVVCLMQTAAIGTVFWLIKRALPQMDRIWSIGVSVGLGAIWAAIYLLINRKKIVFNWKQLNAKSVTD